MRNQLRNQLRNLKRRLFTPGLSIPSALQILQGSVCFSIGFGLVLTFALTRSGAIPPKSIHVDQFGYRPADPKVAVIVLPPESVRPTSASSLLQIAGLTAPSGQAKGQAIVQAEAQTREETYRVRNLQTRAVVYRGRATLWQGGKVHEQSGDRAAWFDFSAVKQPGVYQIENARTGETSFSFEIGENVYRPVLIAATRMFFYQRSGFAKQPPYADSRWTDAAAFLGRGQDTEARFVNDPDNAALAKDLRGGWFDAGDTNKYVTFATQPVHQLLDAYTQNPSIWTDDFNLPESGNGIPDLLDEIKFELDWLKRMQDDDGGAFIKVGTLDYRSAQKPSLDQRPRFYAPKCSSSTIAVASMFAHAALVFRDVPQLAGDAAELQARSIRAWQWFATHPQETNCDTQAVKAGDADWTNAEQVGAAVNAAVYLVALTGEQSYDDYIGQHYQETTPFNDSVWSRYRAFEGDALLFYTRLDRVNRDRQAEIRTRFSELARNQSESYGFNAALDPYRGYMPDAQYHWGSNQVKANYGNTNYDAILYQANPGQEASYQTRALDTLHYFHGVNPLGIVYLTNMYDWGAERSANEMYHEWFGHGIYNNALTSPSGPAPGYLTGGPNKDYSGSAPLREQPPMKVYLDSNKVSLQMWEVTEPAIYYQSAYIKLLSKFLAN